MRMGYPTVCFAPSFDLGMSYCKAVEEGKWKRWKEAEEIELRRSGAPEEMIDRLREYDWEMFKSERRFLERQIPAGSHVDIISCRCGRRASEAEVSQVQNGIDLMDVIEDSALLLILKEADSKTRMILVLKIRGFSTREIAECINLTEKAIYRRMDRIKKK